MRYVQSNNSMIYVRFENSMLCYYACSWPDAIAWAREWRYQGFIAFELVL